MRHRPLRLIAVTALVLATIAWLPGVAAAAEDDAYRASGQASGFAVNVPDVIEVAVARSEGEIDSDILAHGRGVGLLIAEESISEVTIEQEGVTRRDPAEGQNCAFPDLPEPLDLVDAACSFALGETLDGLPRGLGDATGLELELTGADVVALVDFLLEHIDETELDEAIDEVEASVIGPVQVALAEACLEALGPLAEEFEDDANALIDAIEDEGGFPLDIDLDEEDACALLVEYVLNPPVLVEDHDDDGRHGADDLLIQLRDELAAVLDGVSLLDILLGGSVSEGLATAADATGAADAIGVDIALPSLNLLGNLVDVLAGIVDDFLTQVEEDLSTIDDVEYEELDLPAPEDLVDELLAAIPEELRAVLDDDQPLLRITGGHSEASAVFDRSSGDVTTEGQVRPLVIDLADSLAALLQLSDEDPIEVPEGDSVTILEDTPLESTATLAACETEDATEDGLEGQRITCSGLELALLKGLVGDGEGLNVAGASAQAAAFGELGDEEDEPEAAAPPTLPTTGGGLALLGLLAVASALALRRRD